MFGSSASTVKPKWQYFELMLLIKDCVSSSQMQGYLWSSIAVVFEERNIEGNDSGDGDSEIAQSNDDFEMLIYYQYSVSVRYSQIWQVFLHVVF
jgi:hypothetical protein